MKVTCRYHSVFRGTESSAPGLTSYSGGKISVDETVGCTDLVGVSALSTALSISTLSINGYSFSYFFSSALETIPFEILLALNDNIVVVTFLLHVTMALFLPYPVSVAAMACASKKGGKLYKSRQVALQTELGYHFRLLSLVRTLRLESR